MPPHKDILAANAHITNDNGPKVSIFAGGTSGLGKLTIRALVSTGITTRIYLIGRKSSEDSSKAFIKECSAINTAAEIIWVEGDISLLQDAKRICEGIKAKESRVDLLFLSAGYAPFKGREVTSEGLEITQVLEYYSRMLFILHLLPLLESSPAAKVISILAGGLERASMDVDDLNLEKPGNFGGAKAQGHYGAMNTLFLDRLASQHPNVAFIHSWPGWVNTGNVKRSYDPSSLVGWLFWLIVEPIVRIVSMSDETAAQRYLFLGTSAAFGGRGVPWEGSALNALEKTEGAVFLTNYKAHWTSNKGNVGKLREQAQEKVWEKTMEVLGPYL